MQKKSPRRTIFFMGTSPRPPHKGGRRDMVGRSCHLPLWGGREGFLVLPVIRCHLQRPDVRLHRLLAAGGVLLRTVGGLVSGHLRGVFEAGVDSSGDGAEARTLLDLRGLDGRGARDGLTQIQAVTVGVGSLSRAMRAKQHLRAAVLRVLTGF